MTPFYIASAVNRRSGPTVVKIRLKDRVCIKMYRLATDAAGTWSIDFDIAHIAGRDNFNTKV